MNQLDALKQLTTVVADTGDFKSLAQYAPQDATTNPSLILKAAQDPQYKHIVDETLQRYGDKPLDEVIDHLLVRFGYEILQHIPGRVSTEVDARLSFDTYATIARAERIIEMYQGMGVNTNRVLIKIASTWEGIQAAEKLEAKGIYTNLTLLFALEQAVACALAKVTLISPFVGRIYDWYKAQAGSDWNEQASAGANDPGVQSVRAIFHYFKHFGYATEIMGASFRNIGQIQALAGCDLLTISPKLLSELAANTAPLQRALDAADSKSQSIEPIHIDEARFRLAMCQNAMASDKMLDGIRRFIKDTETLETLLTA